MAITSMTRHALEIVPISRADIVASTQSAPVHGRADSALDSIATFIPAEVLAIYIAGFGIIDPDGTTQKWAIFAICGLLIPVFIAYSLWCAIRANKNKAQVRLSLRTWSLLILFGLIAYTAWVAAIPNSPFADIHPNANRYAAWIALILSFLLPIFADWLGLSPSQT